MEIKKTQFEEHWWRIKDDVYVISMHVIEYIYRVVICMIIVFIMNLIQSVIIDIAHPTTHHLINEAHWAAVVTQGHERSKLRM